MKGNSYSLSDWQALGFDTASLVIDPQLDADFVPREVACANAGVMNMGGSFRA